MVKQSEKEMLRSGGFTALPLMDVNGRILGHIPWKDPLIDIPPDGAKVWAIDWHWKQEVPGSYNIVGGTVRHWDLRDKGREYEINLEQNDEAGNGAQDWKFPVKDSEYNSTHHCNVLGAWCYADELNLPEWILEK